MNNNCHHKIKRNYPFGRNSAPRRSCKICGKIISSKELRDKTKSKPRVFVRNFKKKMKGGNNHGRK